MIVDAVEPGGLAEQLGVPVQADRLAQRAHLLDRGVHVELGARHQGAVVQPLSGRDARPRTSM